VSADPLRARFFLEQLALAGTTPNDLLAAATNDPSVHEGGPTVAQYIARIEAQFKESTWATYATHWRLLAERHGERLLAELDADDLLERVKEAGQRAMRRCPGCTGRSAEENCVAGLRALYRRAAKARLIAFDPAAELEQPRRHPSRRRALCAAELEELWEAIGVVSRDPELDMLLVRFHLESGARRAGAIGLCLGDL
jgi:integrase